MIGPVLHDDGLHQASFEDDGKGWISGHGSLLWEEWRDTAPKGRMSLAGG
ncbi:hypothetical protein HMEPL2_37590 [Vreelandella aquamarina]|uniref:Uncharacterized protein n=1 Tax=Vreelandella aquamarina TaxID=77097 RepID=A0A6F8XHY5_9GAMM|nr:hypothetical protein HMEPL2_37590 [Halomonas meridiana]